MTGHRLAALLLPLLGGLAAAWSGAAAGAALAGSEVRITDPLGEDLYAAGQSVTVLAPVDGDGVLAAGSVRLSGDVTGDLLAAGGRVVVEGGVGDDLRAAGGRVLVTGFVTDHAIIAGGSVTLAPESAVAGRVWISAGDASVAGQVGGGLRVMAGTVTIAGQIEGDVDVAARELRVEPGAVIGGDLIWRGRGEPDIAEDARIFGDILSAPPEPGAAFADGDGPATGLATRIVAVLAIFLASAGLWWVAPGLSARTSQSLREAPLKTLFRGVVALVLTPVAVVALFASVIGWFLALVLMAAYVFGLAIAILLGLVALAQGIVGAGQPGAPPSTGGGRFPARRLLVLLILATVFILLRTVPVAGGLVTVLLMLAGLGGLVAVLAGDGRTGPGPPVPSAG